MPVQRLKTKTKASSAVKTSTDAQLVTSSQSLSIVQTLVQTGIGVITYLRGIFPDECFNDDRIGPDRSENGQGNESNHSEMFKKNAREGRGYIRVKKIKPGASKESDHVLDIMDEGVMDAIQRGYLRQLLFAMYLDPDKPRDVIECYTFNFTYNPSSSGEARLVPELEVRDQLKSMSLTGKITISDRGVSDKTGGMVKRQIQTLIKNLICSTQSLSDITGRRFLSFKLYYNDQTPPDYEPPHFGAGDCEKDRFTFGTCGKEEVPSATELGKVDTGFHTVRVALATISDFLQEDGARAIKPLKGDDKGEPSREEYLKTVREQAQRRPVVWDTENILNPSSSPTPDAPPASSPTLLGERGKLEPIGVRNVDGKVVPLTDSTRSEADMGDPKPDKLFKVLEKKADARRDPENEVPGTSSSATEPTQLDLQSQPSPLPPLRSRQQPDNSQQSQLTKRMDEDSMDIDIPTIDLINHTKGLDVGDGGMETIEADSLDLVDTQLPGVSEKDLEKHLITYSGGLKSVTMSSPLSTPIQNVSKVNTPVQGNQQETDLIQSFSRSKCIEFGLRSTQPREVTEDPIEESLTKGPLADKGRTRQNAEVEDGTPPNKKNKTGQGHIPTEHDLTKVCECKDWHDDIAMIMCESCSRWRHLSCYGYQSLEDSRIPIKFTCFRCRIHHGMSLEETWKREDEIKSTLEGLRSLCMFRRTLQIIYAEGMPTAIKNLASRLEIDFTTASQVKKRLIAENYLRNKSTIDSNGSGMLESETFTQKGKKGKGRKKASKPVKGIMTVNQSYEQKQKKDSVYFTPGNEIERKLLKPFSPSSPTNITTDALKDRGNVPSDALKKSNDLSDQIASRTRSWTQQCRVSDHNERINPSSPKGVDDRRNSTSFQRENSLKRKADETMKVKRRSKGKDKVSIDVQNLEVPGVTWDDYSD